MMKRSNTIFMGVLILFTVIILAESQPKMAVSEYFQTTGGGFISHKDTLQYAVMIKPKKLVNGTEKWYATIEYDNPAEKGKPWGQNLEFPATLEEFTLRSDSFSSIKNHKTYKVVLRAYQDAERSKLITTHEQGVRFDIPDKMAKEWGLRLL